MSTRSVPALPGSAIGEQITSRSVTCDRFPGSTSNGRTCARADDAGHVGCSAGCACAGAWCSAPCLAVHPAGCRWVMVEREHDLAPFHPPAVFPEASAERRLLVLPLVCAWLPTIAVACAPPGASSRDRGSARAARP